MKPVPTKGVVGAEVLPPNGYRMRREAVDASSIPYAESDELL